MISDKVGFVSRKLLLFFVVTYQLKIYPLNPYARLCFHLGLYMYQCVFVFWHYNSKMSNVLIQK